MQHQLAREIIEAVRGQADDAGALRAAHDLVGVYLTEVEAAGHAGGLNARDIKAEVALGLRRLRDALQAGQQARTGSAAAAIGEIRARICALPQCLARRAVAQRPGPAVHQRTATAGAPAPWLQVDLPLRARVWSALGEIHQVRRARAAGGNAFSILPDTLQPALVDAWLCRHDMLSDAWAAEIACATPQRGGDSTSHLP